MTVNTFTKDFYLIKIKYILFNCIYFLKVVLSNFLLIKESWKMYTHIHVCFCELWGHSIGVMVLILYKSYFLSPYTNPTPKPTPYRKLCAFLLKKKTNSVWFISLLKYEDMGKCPHNSPSPCNTYVIPMSLYNFVLICHKNTYTRTLYIHKNVYK